MKMPLRQKYSKGRSRDTDRKKPRLQKLIRKQGNGLIKIVTRIRKSGKSYLLDLNPNTENKEVSAEEKDNFPRKSSSL